MRTFVWIYDKSHTLINIHHAKHVEHPYHADAQLFGATEVISLTARHWVSGAMTAKDLEWHDGDFEFEIALGFVGADLFEYMVKQQTLATMEFITFKPDHAGKLVPIFKHVFESCLMENYELMSMPKLRVRCKLHYRQHTQSFFDESTGQSRTHTDKRRSVIVLKKPKLQASSTDTLMLHQMYVPQSQYFYGKPAARTIDDLFFCVVPKAYSVPQFVHQIYKSPTEKERMNFRKTNPHIQEIIQPGQMVFVLPHDGYTFEAFNDELKNSARRIDALRLKYPDIDPAFFAEHFALLGSFSPSVGHKKNQYFARTHAIHAVPENNEQAFGVIPSVAGATFEWMKKEIDIIRENYKTVTEKGFDFVYQRDESLKRMDKRKVVMLDSLMRGGNVTLNKFVVALDDMTTGMQRWVPTSQWMMPLDDLYASVQKATLSFKTLGYLGIGFDGFDTYQETHTACTILREDECREIQFEEWGGFLGRVVAGTALGMGVLLIPVAGGIGVALVAGTTIIAAIPATSGGGFLGNRLGEAIHDHIYEGK